MEQVNAVPFTEQNTDPYPSLTLAQAGKRIRELLLNAEFNAWDIGDLLNTVEKRGLARSEGYGKTKRWLEKEVPEAAGKATTLYRYANVASHYTKKHVKQWGMNKLDYLIVHDRDILGHADSGDPREREVQLLQEDGSTVSKKFHDCTCRELMRSNQRRKKKAAKGPGRAAKARPRTEAHSIRIALALIALGILVSATFGLLEDSVPTRLILLLGTGLFLSGIAMLIRRWHVAKERLLSAFREGKAMDLMKEQLAKARGGARKLVASVRPRGKAKRLATAPKEETPPNEKKAA